MSRDYHARALRIVDRVMPSIPSAHGFYQPKAFVAASRHEGERRLLYWRTFARLRAKAEGGRPFLALPKDCRALEGGAMWIVARELEAAA